MPSFSFAALPLVFMFLTIAGCVQTPVRPSTPISVAPDACPPPPRCAACPVCAAAETPGTHARTLQPADWVDLPGWGEDQLGQALTVWTATCHMLVEHAGWESLCRELKLQQGKDNRTLQAWIESAFRPWALTQPDGSRVGLITGYFEPVLKGSRTRTAQFQYPVFGPPEDLISVDLAELYPELKHLRLRGRLEGRKLIPYYTRADWSSLESDRASLALVWVNDPIDFFFMQIQGSGQIQLADGGRIRLNYADQNGHPYRSIGKWLIDQGLLKPEQASMQGIKAWAKSNPTRLSEMLNTNPSMVFFREIPAEGNGPQGASGAALTPERSIAVDPRHIPLGAPIWLATARPNSDQAMNRLTVAQDTGGAIRGVVRADFYWGSGTEAGTQAGKMRQQGRMWILMPRTFAPG